MMKSSLRHRAALVTCALILTWSPAAYAQVEWTHYSAEPVLEASEEAWSEDGVWAPTVIRAEDDTLKMWFSGGNDGFNYNQIGYAWSLDGVDWTRHPNNPVLLPHGKTPVATYPYVLLDGDTLRMWYAEGNFFDPDFVVRYATSTNGGVTWDRHPTPVIEPGPPGTWNETAVFPGDVIKEDGLFKMWFTGGTGHFVPSPDTRYSIGYATSPDGIEWTLYDDPATTEAPFHLSDPVLPHGSGGDFDRSAVSSASVRRTDAGYELWYHGGSAPGNAVIGYAISPDGIAWTKHEDNPVLTAAGAPLAFELLHPSVLFHDGQYHMWLSLFGNATPPVGYSNIGYATAPVTLAAEPEGTPPGALALGPPYPNPTDAGASLTYRLAQPARVTLKVYDLLGREVARPLDGSRPAGEHTAAWDGRDARGRGLGAGVYVVRLRAGEVTASRKVILLR